METRMSSPREQGGAPFHQDKDHGKQSEKENSVLPTIILKQKNKMERVNLDNIVACVPFQLPPIVQLSSQMNSHNGPLFPEDLENNSFKVSGHTLKQKTHFKTKLETKSSSHTSGYPISASKHPTYNYVTTSKVILQSKSSAEKVQQWINENIALPIPNPADISQKRKVNQRRVVPNVHQEMTGNSVMLAINHLSASKSSSLPDISEKSQSKNSNVTHFSLQNNRTTLPKDQQSKRQEKVSGNSSQTSDKPKREETDQNSSASLNVHNSNTTKVKSPTLEVKQKGGHNEIPKNDSSVLPKSEKDHGFSRSTQDVKTECYVGKLVSKESGDGKETSVCNKRNALKTSSNCVDTSKESFSASKHEAKRGTQQDNRGTKDIKECTQVKKDIDHNSRVDGTISEKESPCVQGSKSVSNSGNRCTIINKAKSGNNSHSVSKSSTSKLHMNKTKEKSNDSSDVSSDDNSSENDDDESASSSDTSSSDNCNSNSNKTRTKRHTKTRSTGKRIPLKVNKKAHPGKRITYKRVRWAVRLVKIRYFQKDELSASDDSSSEDDSD